MTNVHYGNNLTSISKMDKEDGARIHGGLYYSVIKRMRGEASVDLVLILPIITCPFCTNIFGESALMLKNVRPQLKMGSMTLF